MVAWLAFCGESGIREEIYDAMRQFGRTRCQVSQGIKMLGEAGKIVDALSGRIRADLQTCTEPARRDDQYGIGAAQSPNSASCWAARSVDVAKVGAPWEINRLGKLWDCQNRAWIRAMGFRALTIFDRMV